MILSEFHSDFFSQLFKYCSILDIRQLRFVCREFFKKIPIEWTYSMLYMSSSHYEVSSLVSTTKFYSEYLYCTPIKSFTTKYTFLRTLFINKAHFQINYTHIVFSKSNLEDITILGSNVETVSIKQLPYLKIVLFSGNKHLKQVNFENVPNMETINLYEAPCLCSLKIDNWPLLKNVILINTGIRSLSFPERCESLRLLSITSSKFSTLYINSILRDYLNIFIHRRYSVRTSAVMEIYTPRKNAKMIHVDVGYIFEYIIYYL